jgi:hypothetical protein
MHAGVANRGDAPSRAFNPRRERKKRERSHCCDSRTARSRLRQADTIVRWHRPLMLFCAVLSVTRAPYQFAQIILDGFPKPGDNEPSEFVDRFARMLTSQLAKLAGDFGAAAGIPAASFLNFSVPPVIVISADDGKL